jgi:hypothetical protein
MSIAFLYPLLCGVSIRMSASPNQQEEACAIQGSLMSLGFFTERQ